MGFYCRYLPIFILALSSTFINVGRRSMAMVSDSRDDSRADSSPPTSESAPTMSHRDFMDNAMVPSADYCYGTAYAGAPSADYCDSTAYAGAPSADCCDGTSLADAPSSFYRGGTGPARGPSSWYSDDTGPARAPSSDSYDGGVYGGAPSADLYMATNFLSDGSSEARAPSSNFLYTSYTMDGYVADADAPSKSPFTKSSVDTAKAKPPAPSSAFLFCSPCLQKFFSMMYSEVLLIALICIFLAFSACMLDRRSELFYDLLICWTPLVHALDQLLRHLLINHSSVLVLTCFEAGKEMYSSIAVVCFRFLIDTQLKEHYNVNPLDQEHLDQILLNKLFSFHYPMDFKPTIFYTATRKKLFWMRALCFQIVVSTFILYAFRISLEYAGLFGEVQKHVFQAIYFVFSTTGSMAVYAYAQGVDSEIPQKRVSKKMALFKLFLFLMWLEGPGIELLVAIQGWLIMTTLLCVTVAQCIFMLANIRG